MVVAADEHKLNLNSHFLNASAHVLPDEEHVITVASTPTDLAGMVELLVDTRDQMLGHMADEDGGYHLDGPDADNLIAANNGRTLYFPIGWFANEGAGGRVYG
jgi:hypothetical protein